MKTVGLVVMALFLPALTARGADLTALSGCWKGTLEDMTVEERWGGAEGGLMLGTAKSLRSGKAVQYEFLEIRSERKEVRYTPYINGTREVSFLLNPTASNATRLVFENAENDFPVRIVYTALGSALEVELEGATSGQRVKYRLNAIPCTE